CVVAFFSDASDLRASDTNGVRDVFVRDRCAHTTERVSVSDSGQQGNRPSQLLGLPALSDDGEVVVFASDATNLDPARGNGVTDIFVRDRAAGTTRRVSVAANGEPGNGPSQFPSVSADGRFVVFQSAADNLVDGDTNGRTDIFVVELDTHEISRVSLSGTGE